MATVTAKETNRGSATSATRHPLHLERIRKRYYWVGCHQDVQQWSKTCDTRKGPPKVIQAPVAQHSVGDPMQRKAVDMLG